MEEQFDGEKPPSKRWGEFFPWRGVPKEDWDNWRWQLKNSIRNVEQLGNIIQLTDIEKLRIKMVSSVYPMFFTPYYFSLINFYDPEDPIKKQIIPSFLELTEDTGYEEDDPLNEEKESPCSGITHRYSDRVLLITTNFCASFCRHCTRKRIFTKAFSMKGKFILDSVVGYIKEHEEIRDVIVSGGDPLTLPFKRFDNILKRLREIPHVEIIRIGTRIPVVLPQILYDRNLLEILERYGPIWVNTHFNHPNEITEESSKAIENLLRIGIPVNNQTVLLKGVNDSAETLIALSRKLLRIKVRPYYLYHCDPVKGVNHFRTSIFKGIEILEKMRGNISGFGIPTYVVDSPGGNGKIPINPNYILSFTEESVLLRSYRGKIIEYYPEGKRDRGEEIQKVSSIYNHGEKVKLIIGRSQFLRRKNANRSRL
ncbi:MAG: KamA family radical SAM protein [Acidobacteriota bacterium]